MINIIKGSGYKALSEILAGKVTGEEPSIFRPTHIVVPNLLIEEWIKEAIARKNGIAANIRFYRLDDFFSHLIYLLQADEVYERPYSLNDLDWLVYEILGAESFTERFPDIGKYYADDEVKRFALAEKTVRLLDKYQHYRPELIRNWAKEDHAESNDWQAFIFQKLRTLCGKRALNKAFEVDELSKLLKDADKLEKLQSQIGTVHVFGNISFSPLSFQLLQAVETHLAVNIYRTHLDYKEDSLAKSWGKVQDEFWQAIEKYLPDAVMDTTNTGLAGNALPFQNIIAGKKVVGNFTGSPDKLGIEIHSCHTRIREVESLYNYLVRKTAEDKQLGSRDMVVYAPNLKQYIAQIKTVFDTAPYHFPYRIVSKSYTKEETFWTALIELLAIDEDSFTAPEVFKLLELNPIRTHFGFENIDLLRKMIQDAGIRCLLEGNSENETRFVSWRYGLKRLYYGYLLGQNDLKYHDGNEDLYTVDLVEGSGAHDLFRLNQFVDLLADLMEARRTEKSLQQWLQWLYEAATGFINMFDGVDVALQRFLQNIGSVSELLEDDISFRVFKFRIKSQLEAMELKSLKGFGGIIFTDLLPGRAMPKKIAAVLGMNFREYPRTGKLLSFDKLAEEEPALLDPDSKASDQHTFMDVVFSGEQAVYISYLGQSDQDNVKLHASTMVEEIQLKLAEKTAIDMDTFGVKHPLHLHSNRYNTSQTGALRNYISLQQAGVELRKSTNDYSAEDNIPDLVELRDLEKFYFKSLEFYCNKELGIYYRDSDGELEDAELFDLDNLAKWVIRNEFLFATEAGDFASIRLEKVMKAQLPLGMPGTEYLQTLYDETKPLIDEVNKLGDLSTEKLEVQLDSGLPMLSGAISLAGNDHGLYAIPSEYRFKYALRAFIRYLFLASCRDIQSFTFIARGKDKPLQVKKFPILTSEEARSMLRVLLENYLAKRAELFLYIADIHQDIEKKRSDEKTNNLLKELETILEKKSIKTDHNYIDPYFLHLYNAGFFNTGDNMNILLENTQWMNELTAKIFTV